MHTQDSFLPLKWLEQLEGNRSPLSIANYNNGWSTPTHQMSSWHTLQRKEHLKFYIYLVETCQQGCLHAEKFLPYCGLKIWLSVL
jgi:hypothetical protein